MRTERNPKHGTFMKPDGYRDLGWQLRKESCPDYAKCVEAGHNRGKWREFDNSLFVCRGTDIITICDECKTIWHTDMSD